jgi:hypothetical protein
VEMVVSGDAAAETSLNEDVDLRWEEGDATENQTVLPDLKNDVEGGGLKNNEIEQIQVFSKSGLFLILDELKPDKETKKIVPQFDVLFPYYLRNDRGIEMKCEIMGCKYLDYGILKVFPDLKDELTSVGYVLNIPVDAPMQSTKTTWENLSDGNINNKNLSIKSVSNDVPSYVNSVVTVGGHDLSYILHVSLCLLLILIVVCMISHAYSSCRRYNYHDEPEIYITDIYRR